MSCTSTANHSYFESDCALKVMTKKGNTVIEEIEMQETRILKPSKAKYIPKGLHRDGQSPVIEKSAIFILEEFFLR